MAVPSFNQIPGSGLVAPIMAFEVNSGGQYSQPTRMILLGYKTSAGNLALNTPTPVASLSDADGFAGKGSMLREMWRVAQFLAPTLPIWMCAVAEPGTTKASWTITVNAAPLPSPGAGYFEICGRLLQIAVTATDTAATIAANIAATINAYYDPLTGAALPVTATSAAAVVTVTARHAGAIMNDVEFYQPTWSYNVLAGTALAIASATAGTGTPDISAALAAIGDQRSDFLVGPFGDSANLAAVGSAFGDVSGRWSYLKMTYGAYWFPISGTFSALITAGAALPNLRQIVPIGRPSGSPTPSWIWVAERAALEASWLSDIVTGNVSRNQTGRQTAESRPPRDPTTWWGYNARNQLLQAKVSTIQVSADGHVAVDKTITAYSVNQAGSPDTVFRDVQAVYQVGLGLPFVRAMVQQEHGNKSLMRENPGSLQAATTPADIKATLIHAIETLELRGVFQNVAETARQIIVRVNDDNPARVDCFLPIERVNPFDILAVNATIYQRLPS